LNGTTEVVPFTKQKKKGLHGDNSKTSKGRKEAEVLFAPA
jgi:hypothetical protein